MVYRQRRDLNIFLGKKSADFSGFRFFTTVKKKLLAVTCVGFRRNPGISCSIAVTFLAIKILVAAVAPRRRI